jgi:hypothetical protein
VDTLHSGAASLKGCHKRLSLAKIVLVRLSIIRRRTHDGFLLLLFLLLIIVKETMAFLENGHQVTDLCEDTVGTRLGGSPCFLLAGTIFLLIINLHTANENYCRHSGKCAQPVYIFI